MQIETIDTFEVIRLFHEIMKPSSDMRVVRLIGDANMGKSHLLTKIFPTLAVQDYQARYAILDLRNRMLTIPDILHFACSSLGESHFDRYQDFYRQWSTKPKVTVEGMTTLFSRTNIVAEETAGDRQARDRELTNRFVQDLSRLNNTLVLLLIDSFNSAKEKIQIWLMDTLIALVSQHTHVRVIIAGRTLPDAPGSYATCCQTVRLRAVKDIGEYITYCKKINATLEEQSIRDFAFAVDYTPGLFANFAYKFTEGRM